MGEDVLCAEGYSVSIMPVSTKCQDPHSDFYILNHRQISEGTEDSQRKLGFLDCHFLGSRPSSAFVTLGKSLSFSVPIWK